MRNPETKRFLLDHESSDSSALATNWLPLLPLYKVTDLKQCKWVKSSALLNYNLVRPNGMEEAANPGFCEWMKYPAPTLLLVTP